MFVLEALVLTFMTFYPPHLRLRIVASGAIFDNIPVEEGAVHKAHGPLRDGEFKTRLRNSSNQHLHGFRRTKAMAPLCMNRGFCNASTIPLAISLEAPGLIELSDRVFGIMKIPQSSLHASGKRLVRLWASLASFQRCKDAKDVKTSCLWKVGYLVSERHNTSFRDVEHLSKPCPGLSKDHLCTSFWFSVECLWYLWTVLFHKNNWYALQKCSYSSSDITM